MKTSHNAPASGGPLRPMAWLLYAAIGLEILFMISPAAAYFYAVYGPVLNALDDHAATAWLTQFFLPHLSTTKSFVLNGLPWLGGVCVVLGAAGFVVAAVPLYWSQLRRRGLVTTGLYRYIRHPQYASLALLGLGALLVWPRFFVLVAYVLMLFLYRALAAMEERECEARYGRPYRQYAASAWAPWSRFGAPLAEGQGWLALARGGGWVLAALAVSLLLAQGLREYALTRISAVYAEHAVVLSPALLRRDELSSAYRTALEDPRVQQAVQEGQGRPLVIHVVPRDWHLADLPLEAEPVRRGHVTPARFDRRHYRVLFSRARTHRPMATGKSILRSAHGIEPLWVVAVDIEAGTITGVDTPPAHVQWGDIPTPLY